MVDYQDTHPRGTLSHLKAPLAALAAALAFASCASHAETAGNPIRIGALVSLTGGGATSGFSGLTGAKMAIQEINATGGVKGRMLELVVADDQSDPTAAVNEARRLANSQKVDFVYGPLSSQLTLASVPVLRDAKIPQVFTSGSSLLTPAFTPLGFSMNPSAEDQANLMVEQIKTFGGKKVGILIDNGAQTKSGLEYIKSYLSQDGITIAAEQEFPFRSEDKTPQLLSLKGACADSLIIWANTVDDMATILNNEQDIGWQVNMSGAIAQTMFAQPVTKLVPKEYLGRIASVAYRGWTYCPGDKVDDLPYVQFKKRLAAFETARAKDLAPTIAAWGYDAVYLYKAAVESGAQSGPEIAAWIEKNSASVPAVSGKLDGVGPNSHFLVGIGGMTLVDHLGEPGPEGLFPRTDCTKK